MMSVDESNFNDGILPSDYLAEANQPKLLKPLVDQSYLSGELQRSIVAKVNALGRPTEFSSNNLGMEKALQFLKIEYKLYGETYNPQGQALSFTGDLVPQTNAGQWNPQETHRYGRWFERALSNCLLHASNFLSEGRNQDSTLDEVAQAVREGVTAYKQQGEESLKESQPEDPRIREFVDTLLPAMEYFCQSLGGWTDYFNKTGDQNEV